MRGEGGEGREGQGRGGRGGCRIYVYHMQSKVDVLDPLEFQNAVSVDSLTRT